MSVDQITTEPDGSFTSAEITAARLRAADRLGLSVAARGPAFQALTSAVNRLLGLPGDNVAVICAASLQVCSGGKLPLHSEGYVTSLTLEVVATGRPIVISDARRDARCLAHSGGWSEKSPLVFYLGVPLKTNEGLVIGVLCAIGNSQCSPPDPAHLTIIEALARSAVTVLELEASKRDHWSTEQELLRRKELLEATLQSIDQGVTAYDAGHRLVTWNRKAAQIYGSEDTLAFQTDLASACMGLARLGFYGPGDPLQLAGERIRAVGEMLALPAGERGGPQVLETQLNDGRTIIRKFCFLENGCLSVFRDVTEQRRRERVLKSQARFFEMQAGLAAIANSAANVREAVSALLQRLCTTLDFELGCAHVVTGGELHPLDVPYRRGQRFKQESIPCKDQQTARPGFLAVEALHRGSITLNRPNLQDSDLGDLASFDDPASIMSGFACTLRSREETFVLELYSRQEITVRLWQRALFSHLEAQLSFVDERAKSERQTRELVATVSHELRTPLTAMRGMIELLESGLFGEFSPSLSKRLATAGQQCRSVGRTVETMLNDSAESIRSTVPLIQTDNLQGLRSDLEQVA